MNVARPASLALLAALALALAGCRTAGVNDLTRSSTIAPRSSEEARALIDEHNRNARLIQTFKAKPSITVRTAQGTGGVYGHLYLDRPRFFLLEVSHAGSDVANIGSNDREFWFWVKDAKQRAIYYCGYDEIANSALAATFQPDWIIEALGLRIIPDEEADDITVTRGTESGTLVLTHRPTKVGSKTTTRVTVLDAKHRIKEHRLLSGDQKTVLAVATVTSGYQEVAITSGGKETGESVFVPRALRLNWVQEKMVLEVELKAAEAGPEPFTQAKREARFVEPKFHGYNRINLATLKPSEAPEIETETAQAPETSIRETMPAPPTRVRLSDPVPLGVEDSGRANREPIARAGAVDDLPPRTALVDEYVGPRIPSPPEPDGVKAESGTGTGWRNATSPSNFER